MSDPDEPSGIHCTDWEESNGSSVCQVKAVCSEDCSVWVANLNPNLDLLLVESEQDVRRLRQKLEGALGFRVVTKDEFFRKVGKR
jgi:hypothetical protein